MQMAAPMAPIRISSSYGLVPVSQVPATHVHGATLLKGMST